MNEKKPCRTCPWRKRRPARVPGERGPGHIEEVKESFHPHSIKVMECHSGHVDHPQPCAGFMVEVGPEHPGVKLLKHFGWLNHEYTIEGVDVWPDFETMLSHMNDEPST